MSSGPDWTDVEAAMRACQESSAGAVSLTILPRGTGSTGGLRVALAWSPKLEAVGGQEEIVLSESMWPCPQGCTLPEHVYSGIAVLDYRIADMIERGEIPKA